jgi:hypothetical protein
VLKEDGDGAWHMRSRGKGGAKVEGHDIKCREKTKPGKRVQPLTQDAFPRGGNQAFVEQCLCGHEMEFISAMNQRVRLACVGRRGQRIFQSALIVFLKAMKLVQAGTYGGKG